MDGKVKLDHKFNALQKTVWALMVFTLGVILLLYLVIHLGNIKVIVSSIKVLILLMSLMMTLIIVMAIGFLVIRRTTHGSKVLKVFYRLLHVMYPFLYAVGKLLGMEKNEIRRSYISINNHLVHLLFSQFTREKSLILTPHCLQNSDCNVKVTGQSNHCLRCGKCDIQKLVEISETYNIPLIVATGGTLARRAIEDIRPELIFAVACERDLAAGIYDIQKIPVVGILNDRPNGPCFNTMIEVDKIKVEIESLTQPVCEG